jgi:hypothetical protein
MAIPTQYSFSLAEAAEALIKHQGIHEGKWTVVTEFGFNAGFAGVNPTDTKLSAIVTINSIILSRAQDGLPAQFVVDAATVNPPKK